MSATRPNTASVVRVASAVLLPVLVVAAILWQVQGTGETLDDWTYPDIEPPLEVRSDQPVAQTPGLDTTHPLAVEIVLKPEAYLIGNRSSSGRGRIELTSRRGALDAACTLEFAAGPATGRREHLRGAAVVEAVPQGLHLLVLEGPNGARTERVVRVPTRHRIVVDWSRRSAIEGLVFDANGDPLGGAAVATCGTLAATDTTGRFRVPALVEGNDVPVVVTAESKASYYERVRVRRGAQLRFVLEEGGAISGVVHAQPATLARVCVLPVNYRDPRTHSFPFFLDRYARIGVDARGRFRCTGLPLQPEVAFGVVHPTCRLDGAVSVQPARGRARRTAVNLITEGLPILHGRVLDAKRQPVAGAIVTAEPAGRGEPWGAVLLRGSRPALLQGQVAWNGATRTRTDANGRFQVGLVGPRSRVRVEAKGFSGRARVFPRRSRLRHDFVLDAAVATTAEKPVLYVVFDAAEPTRALDVLLRWSGKARDRSFLHDPREPLLLPLGRPAVLSVGVRKTRGDPAVMRSVAVRGKTVFRVTIPRT